MRNSPDMPGRFSGSGSGGNLPVNGGLADTDVMVSHHRGSVNADLNPHAGQVATVNGHEGSSVRWKANPTARLHRPVTTRTGSMATGEPSPTPLSRKRARGNLPDNAQPQPHA